MSTYNRYSVIGTINSFYVKHLSIFLISMLTDLRVAFKEMRSAATFGIGSIEMTKCNTVTVIALQLLTYFVTFPSLITTYTPM